MDGINALIATGGGYRPPQFDLQTAQTNAMRNQLMQQQVQAQPYQQQLKEEEIRLKEIALDIHAKAMSQNKAGNISLDYDWGTISGDAQKMADVAAAVAAYPDQANGPEFSAYLAKNGISLKAKSPEKISPYGQEALSFAEKKAQIESKYREPKDEKSKTEEQLTRAALREAFGREPTNQEILDAMQERAVNRAKSMPAPTVYVGTTPEGKPIVTGGTKGSPELRTPEVPGGGKIGPKLANMPSEMVVAEQQISTLNNTLQRVDDNFDAEFVGPLAGRFGALKEQWTGLPEKQAMFYADLAQINNSLVYLMSGKQINEQEFKRLQKQLPIATLPESVFKSRMKTFRSTLDSILEERHKNMKGYGVNPEQKKNTIGRFTVEVE